MYSYKIGISAEEHDHFVKTVTKLIFYRAVIGLKLRTIGIMSESDFIKMAD